MVGRTEGKFLKKAVYFIVALLFVFASCMSEHPSKTLKVAIERPIGTLNYQKTAATTDMEQLAQIMEGLLVFNEQGDVIPAGAKSWTISDDGLVYRFSLRTDALWQDGTPVLAQDYRFAWLEILRHKTSPFAYTLFPIKQAENIYEGRASDAEFGVDVIDDLTLEITLEKPYLSFIYSLATPTMYPLKQTFYESIGQENFGLNQERILTNGAYNLLTYDASSKLLLQKSETYWDKKHVSIPRVEVAVVPEEAARRVLFNEGNLDIMSVGADARQYYEMKKDSAQILTKKSAKINYLYLSGNTLQHNKLLQNEHFRQAIGQAIDHSMITENILKDGSTALSRIVPCAFAFVDNIDYCALGSNEQSHQFDLAQAQAFFAQAKAEVNEALELQIVYQEAENNVLVLENIKFQLEQNLPGLHVTLKGVPVSGYSAVLRKDGTASAVQTWSGSFANPEVYLQILSADSNFNFGKYDNAAYDAKYMQAMQTIDKRRQFLLYKEAEEMALASYMFLPLYQQGITYVISPGVTEFNYKMTLPNMYYKDMQLR